MNFNPCLLILSGPPFTGKTTLSRMLANRSNFLHVDIDDYRIKAVGHDGIIPEDQDIAITSKCYETMHEYSLQMLQEHTPVSIAATYWRPAYKPLLKAFLQKVTVPIKIFELSVPDTLVNERIERRRHEGSPSDVKSLEQYLHYKNNFDPIKFPGKILLDTEHSPEVDLENILKTITSLRRQ